MITQHIGKRHRTDDCPHEIRPLRGKRRNQEAAVAAAERREAARIGDAAASEIFRGGDEIVEHVLLPFAHAVAMPILTEFAAAAQIRDRIHAAGVEPRHDRRRERRRQRHVEPAVSVENGRRRTIERQISARKDVHRHAGAVV